HLHRARAGCVEDEQRDRGRSPVAGHLLGRRPGAAPRQDPVPRSGPRMSERETLTWELFGTAGRELAQMVADDDYRPDIILSIARGGLFVAGALGYALDVKNLHV